MRRHILARPIVLLICTTPMITLILRDVDSLIFRVVFTSMATIVGRVLYLVVRVSLDLLVEVGDALCPIED